MNIYIGNLSPDVTEGDLQSTFEAFGRIISAKVIKDKYSGASRGFGFVEMASKSEALAAIGRLNESELKGRKMRVNEARPRTNDPYGRGGSGGKGWPRY